MGDRGKTTRLDSLGAAETGCWMRVGREPVGKG